MKQLAAWEGRDGRFYLSAFVGAHRHANGATPARAFDTREALEEYAAARKDSKRRSPQVIWEPVWPEPEPPQLEPPDGQR